MSYMNRLGNVTNKFQTDAKKVLCLCSAGLLRSPTVANVLHQEHGYNTRAAGVTEEYALIPVDDVLLQWADEVVCVERAVFVTLANRFDMNNKHMNNKRVVVLDIPDMFAWNDPALRELIKEQYNETL